MHTRLLIAQCKWTVGKHAALWAEESNQRTRTFGSRILRVPIKTMNTEIDTTVAGTGIKRSGFPETVLPAEFHTESTAENIEILPEKSGAASIHWSWACRKVNSAQRIQLEDTPLSTAPSPGDVALVRVEETKFHK